MSKSKETNPIHRMTSSDMNIVLQAHKDSMQEKNKRLRQQTDDYTEDLLDTEILFQWKKWISESETPINHSGILVSYCNTGQNQPIIYVKGLINHKCDKDNKEGLDQNYSKEIEEENTSYEHTHAIKPLFVPYLNRQACVFSILKLQDYLLSRGFECRFVSRHTHDTLFIGFGN